MISRRRFIGGATLSMLAGPLNVEGQQPVWRAVPCMSVSSVNAFTTASRSHAGAIVILSSPFVSQYGELLASLSVAHPLPTVSMFREHVAAGCLMAYGPSLVDLWRRLGSLTGRVLKGTKPGDLPIERPTIFELIINLKTAKALGLTIPPSLLLRADEVIE